MAGVQEIVVCTPPQPQRRARSTPCHPGGGRTWRASTGVFALGGAQAIAALAFGTESVPRGGQDRRRRQPVRHPGQAPGLWRGRARRRLAGPTETVVVADDSANPAWVAADLLAQAEHDVLATAILLTPSRALAEAVQVEVARQIEQLEPCGRSSPQSLAGQGGIVLTPRPGEAVALADEFAPEHLCLSVATRGRWVGQDQNAGGLFLGEHSFEVLGDYVAGPSHVMPTGGTARFASPLNVLDFVKHHQPDRARRRDRSRIGPAAAALARAELLTRQRRRRGQGRGCGRDRAQEPWQASTSARQCDPTDLRPTSLPWSLHADLPVRGGGRTAWAARPSEIVKLDANENPYGPSPRVREALADLPIAAHLPGPREPALRAALAGSPACRSSSCWPAPAPTS